MGWVMATGGMAAWGVVDRWFRALSFILSPVFIYTETRSRAVLFAICMIPATGVPILALNTAFPFDLKGRLINSPESNYNEQNLHWSVATHACMHAHMGARRRACAGLRVRAPSWQALCFLRYVPLLTTAWFHLSLAALLLPRRYLTSLQPSQLRPHVSSDVSKSYLQGHWLLKVTPSP